MSGHGNAPIDTWIKIFHGFAANRSSALTEDEVGLVNDRIRRAVMSAISLVTVNVLPEEGFTRILTGDQFVKDVPTSMLESMKHSDPALIVLYDGPDSLNEFLQ